MKRQLLDAGWSLQSGNPKHRYVYVLDKADKRLVALVESKRQPYPKRSVRLKQPGDAPGDQSGEGGSTPTQPLMDLTAQRPERVGGSERLNATKNESS